MGKSAIPLEYDLRPSNGVAHRNKSVDVEGRGAAAPRRGCY